MKRPIIWLLSAILSAACHTNQPKPAESENANPVGFLVRQPAFTTCELEAFISLIAARNAIALGASKDSLLGAKNTGEFQVAMINELFERKKDKGFRDYPMFAAEKFYQCTERSALPVAKNLNGAAVCLERQDIGFYLYARKTNGLAKADAIATVKKMFAKSSKDIYPDSLIDQTADMVYRATSEDDLYEIRRFSFETCLFPNEWKAWWDRERAVR